MKIFHRICQGACYQKKQKDIKGERRVNSFKPKDMINSLKFLEIGEFIPMGKYLYPLQDEMLLVINPLIKIHNIPYTTIIS